MNAVLTCAAVIRLAGSRHSNAINRSLREATSASNYTCKKIDYLPQSLKYGPVWLYGGMMLPRVAGDILNFIFLAKGNCCQPGQLASVGVPRVRNMQLICSSSLVARMRTLPSKSSAMIQPTLHMSISGPYLRGLLSPLRRSSGAL